MANKKKTTTEPETADQPAAGSDEPARELREPAEVRYRQQLEALVAADRDPRPLGWKLSPRAVLAYVVGGKKLPAAGGRDAGAGDVEITRKFFGDDTIVERAIVTLASERALLLVGEPGTGKSWLSEHLAAAISGNSTLTIQGTAGTTEDQIKYSWNIARVIAEGPKPENMIPSPTLIGMRTGALLRFEEITRCIPDVQDALVSILSDKALSVPELPDQNRIGASPGFNVIATANSRDQGVNELSAALKRRFNYVHIPVVADHKTEVEIVRRRSAELLREYRIPLTIDAPILDLLATVFREMRTSKSAEGVSLKTPTTALSTAEAIGVALESALHARYFGDGKISGSIVARNLLGSVIKEDLGDREVLKEYATVVARKRGAKDRLWQEFHDAVIDSIG
jgi:MoxR-like ATPase